MRFQLILALGVLCVACSSSKPSILASTPQPTQTEQETFGEPTAKLEFSVQDVDWSPVIIGPDSTTMLVEALKSKASIMVISGTRMQSPSDEHRIFQMVKAASPQTQIVARNKGILDEILLEKGEVPYRQTLEVGGQDFLGRPYLIPKNHPLKTDWLSKKKELKGAQAILIIDYVRPDDQKLRQMRAQHKGGCQALFSEIAKAIDDSGVFFDSLITEVNQALAEEFSLQLKAALPFWQNELSEGLAAVDATSSEARCYKAYQKYVDTYQRCIDGDCLLAPAMHTQGGGVIGMEMSSAVAIPSGCVVNMGRDYVSELAALGKRASSRILQDIPNSWAGAFSKLKVLEKFEHRIEEVCAPAHRRYSADDLTQAKLAVSAFLQKASTAQILGKWTEAEGKQRIAGVGSITVFGRTKQDSSKFTSMFQELSGALKPLSRCRDSKRRPLQVVLVDVGSSEVFFSTILFEEQLFCEEMSPQ